MEGLDVPDHSAEEQFPIRVQSLFRCAFDAPFEFLLPLLELPEGAGMFAWDSPVGFPWRELRRVLTPLPFLDAVQKLRFGGWFVHRQCQYGGAYDLQRE